MRRGIVVAAACAGAAAALVAAGSALGRQAAPVTLRGTVGPGFTISLTRAGKKVTRLAPGTYRLVVRDRSAAHNFELERETGAELERRVTSVPFRGTRTIAVRLTRGSWKFYCKPHESTMRGDFAVGNVAADDRGGDDEREPGDDRGGRRGKG